MAGMLYDRAEIKGNARITKDGYFVADALVARANNVQTYFAHELGLTDRDPQSLVRVFRPAEEVFHKDAMASIAHRPITLDHPAGEVSAENWKALAVGDVGDEIVRDGEFVRVPFRVMDAKAIESIRTDHREFSLGYAAMLDLTPGEHDGQPYDAVASKFRYNHLAAVKAARGGAELRIIDERTYSPDDNGGNNPSERRETSSSQYGEKRVATKTILVDGLQVEVTDAAEAAINKLTLQLADAASAKATVETELATAKTEIATKDAEIVTLKQAIEDAKVTPAQLRDAAKAYAAVCGKAKALGATFAEDADAEAIMKAVVDAKMGDAAKGWTAEQIAASFAVLTKDAKVETPDPLRDAITGGVHTQTADSDVQKAYSDMVDEQTNAWKPKQAA